MRVSHEYVFNIYIVLWLQLPQILALYRFLTDYNPVGRETKNHIALQKELKDLILHRTKS